MQVALSKLRANRAGISPRKKSMVLVAYRHGLRASEVRELQWHQIELSEGRLHVHRVKNGTPRVHWQWIGSRIFGGDFYVHVMNSRRLNRSKCIRFPLPATR